MQPAKGPSHQSSFQDDVQKALLGMSVITKYNNQIIRIDDIDFSKNPMSTFDKKGTPVNSLLYSSICS